MEFSTAPTNSFRQLLSTVLSDVLQQPLASNDTIDVASESAATPSDAATVAVPSVEQLQHDSARTDADPYAARIAEIKQKFTADAAAAAEAMQRLQQAAQEARQKELEALAAADAAYTPAWRRTGLPAKASQLALDPSWLSALQLLDPAAIMDQQRKQQQTEVLQPPAVFEYCNKEAEPHYLQETSNLKVRQKIARERLTTAKTHKLQQTKQSATLNLGSLGSSNDSSKKAITSSLQPGQLPATSSSPKGAAEAASQQQQLGLRTKSRVQGSGSKSVPWCQLADDEVAQKMSAAAARYKAMAAIMTPQQREIEEQIIKSMYHKLNFLHNPRYTPSPSAAAAPAVTGPPGNQQYSLCGTRSNHKQQQQRRRQQQQPTINHSSYGSTSSPIAAAKVHITPADAGLSVSPADGVVFDTYEPSGVYFQTVQIQNVGAVMRGLRLLPPASRYFQISLPKFPSSGNELASGMSCELSVCFTPDSLGDYEDSFEVETMVGRFEVMLLGRRHKPQLTLPDVIQVGEVLVGNSRSRKVEFINRGGSGKFLILPLHEWEAIQQQHHKEQQQRKGDDANVHDSKMTLQQTRAKSPSSSTVRHPDHLSKLAAAAAAQASTASTAANSGAFSITPTYLDLAANSSGNFTVNFTPAGVKFQEGDFVLVCDNCTIRRLSVQGYGSEVVVQLLELDGRELCDGEVEAPVWFGQVHPGCSCSRTIRLHNQTNLQFPYRWQIDGSTTQQKQQQKPRQQQAFKVYPSTGIIKPGEIVDFMISFSPPTVAEHAAVATLLVERSGDALLRTIDTVHLNTNSSSGSLLDLSSDGKGTADGSGKQRCRPPSAAVEKDAEAEVCEQQYDWQAAIQMRLEGQGVPILVTADPGAVVHLPGCIAVGEVGEQQLLLHNATPAPAHYSIDTSSSSNALGSAAVVIADPATGAIPPQSSQSLIVKFIAQAAGLHTGNLIVNVRNGQAVILATRVMVQEPCIVPDVACIDFGIISVGQQSSKQLLMRNNAAACNARWAIEHVQDDKNLSTGVLMHCEPNAGVLSPAAAASTDVTVMGSIEGSHRLLLRVSSGSSHHSNAQQQQMLSQHQYVEVLVTIAAPKVVLDTYRIQLPSAYLGVQQQRKLMITNNSRLPLQYAWAVQQQQQQQRMQRYTENNKSNKISATPTAAAGGGGSLKVTMIPAEGSLQPGEQQQVMLLLEPLTVGAAQVLCCCQVPGMPMLCGVVITAVIEGLQVKYAVERPLQPSLAAAVTSMTATAIASAGVGNSLQRSWQQQQRQNEENSKQDDQMNDGDSESVLVVDFGVVSLHQVGELLLRVTNQTSIDTTVRAWVSRFPAAAAAGGLLATTAAAAAGSGATAVRVMSPSSTSKQQLDANRRRAELPSTQTSHLQQQQQLSRRTQSPSSRSATQQQQQQQCGLAARLAQAVSGTGQPGRISPATGQLQGPFSAAAGNTAMAARLVAAAAAAALGVGCRGCAVVVEPDAADLVGWGCVELRLIAYNNLPGTYVDYVNIQVGDLPVRSIPLRLQVVGSPLIVRRERVQHLELLQQHQQSTPPPAAAAGVSAGIATATAVGQQSTSKAAAAAGVSGVSGGYSELKLGLGSLPVGMQQQQTFYVSNTSALPMHLAWKLQCAPTAAAAYDAMQATETAAAASNDSINSRSQAADESRTAGTVSLDAATAAADTMRIRPTSPDAAGGVVVGSTAATQGSKTIKATGSKTAATSSSSKAAKVSSRPGSAASMAAAAAGSCGGGGKPSSANGRSSVGGNAAATSGSRAASVSGASAAAKTAANASVVAESANAAKSDTNQQQQQTGGVRPTSAESAVDHNATAAAAAAAAAVDDTSGNESNDRNAASPSLLPEGGPSSLLQTLQCMEQSRKQQHQLKMQQTDTGGCSAAATAAAAGTQAVDSSYCFIVEPMECVIQPGQQQKFTIKFVSQVVGTHSVKLIGQQKFVQQQQQQPREGGDGAVKEQQQLRVMLWPKADTGTAAAAAGDAADANVQVIISGGFHAMAGPPPLPLPQLQVSLSATAAAAAAALTPDDSDCLHWTVSSTDDPDSHNSFRHNVTMSNQLQCPLVFQLSAEGPFEIVGAVTSVMQDPDAFRGMKGADAFTQAIKQSGSNSSSGANSTTIAAAANATHGRLLLLPPGESVDVSLLFRPPPAALAPVSAPLPAAAAAMQCGEGNVPSSAAGSAAALAAAVHESEVLLSGALVVTTTNGEVQRLPLTAAILHPVVAVAPSVLSFGSVHSSAPKQMKLSLINPTKVDASWQIQLLPVGEEGISDYPQQQQQQRMRSVAGSLMGLSAHGSVRSSVAAAAAAGTSAGNKAVSSRSSSSIAGGGSQCSAFHGFSVEPSKGVIPGRGLGMPKTQQVMVTFAPSSGLAAAAAELRVLVVSGSGCVVKLEGQGSLEETREHQAVLKDW